jgi:hypothetical protein
VTVVLSVVAAIVAVVLLLPLLSDLCSCALALARRPVGGGAAPERELTERRRTNPRRARLLFLVPAHDEEDLIGDCVRAILSMDYPAACRTVVVVADNCSDATAARARAAGATCLERHDAANRGKPRAVAWALDRVGVGAFDAVVLVDADAVVAPGYAAALDRRGPLNGKAVECYDDVRNRGASPLTRMAAVLAAARFRGAFVLKRRAGLNVPLSDGMCIGTDVLRARPWRAFGLSEDWELYAMLTAEGVEIDLAADARLRALEARTLAQSDSQRQRWLAGRISALATVAPAIVRSRCIGWRQKLDALGELASPGPAVHAGLVALLAGALIVGGAPGATMLASALAASVLRPVAWTCVGLRYDPEPGRALRAFAAFPGYVAWRLVVALRSARLLRPGAAWVRTART